MNPFHAAFAAGAAAYYVFQDAVAIPDFLSAGMVAAWAACWMLDMHSTIRRPSMIQYETNPLLLFLHGRLGRVSAAVQFAIEAAILSAPSLLALDPFQTFGLLCSCLAACHASCWRHNERARARLAGESGPH